MNEDIERYVEEFDEDDLYLFGDGEVGYDYYDDLYFSPLTAWEKDPFETDEEYIERIQDQEDWLESFD